jgi:Arc/MetJ-type ribon-helix-helix transcriptional regulator
MTTYRVEKIAISLPSHAAEHARRAVRTGRASSVSAYIAAAIEEKSQKESLVELLDEMLLQTGGPMTSAERRKADRLLGISASKRTKAR